MVISTFLRRESVLQLRMWLMDSPRVKPAAQIVYGSKALLQDTVNGETGGGSSAIHITTGIFSTWRGIVDLTNRGGLGMKPSFDLTNRGDKMAS